LDEHLAELPDEAEEATEVVTPFVASSEKRSNSDS
jgi:hypothetical protein